MWFLFHHNVKTRAVAGGHTFVARCSECHEQARFIEVEVEENLGVWFVDVIGDRQRAMRCGACHKTFEIPEQPRSGSARRPALSPARPAPPKRSADELKFERLLAERERREAQEAKATRIEDELAELKKRMGR